MTDLKQQEATPTADFNWIGFFSKYRVSILASFGIMAVVLCGWALMRYQANVQEEKAAELYLVGSNKDVWERVVARYPNTSKAASAMLNLASQAVEAKDFKQASVWYEKFIKGFPSHAACDGAELAYAQCLGNSGKIEEARVAYQRITQAKPQHPYCGMASIALARLYEGEGKRSNARETLNDFISRSTSKSSSFTEAQSMLERLNQPVKVN